MRQKITRYKCAGLLLMAAVIIVFGLLYLNSAAYSAWVSGGPPNDYPQVWLQRAVRHLSYAIALILVGILTGLAALRGMQVLKSKSAIVAAFIVIGILAWPHARQFFLVDACLDQGGAWDYEHFTCKH